MPQSKSVKKICTHPVPESNTKKVIENLLASHFQGKNLYNVEDKDSLIDDLETFYSCPVCSRWRKGKISESGISIKIEIYDKQIIPPVMSKWGDGMDVYVPYLISLDSESFVYIDLGFHIILPDNYVAVFYPEENKCFEGLIIQSNSISSKQKKSTIITIHNVTSEPIILHRSTPIGHFMISSVPIIQYIDVVSV